MMRIFVTALLVSALMAVERQSFLLPDRMHDVRAHLKKIVSEAERTLIIATPSLHEKALSDAIAKAAERGTSVTLVTSAEPGDAGGLVRYANVRLLTLEGLRAGDFDGRLEVTLLLADGRTGCLGTLPLIHEALAHSVGILECSDDPAAARRYGAYLDTMIARSSPYLRP